MELPSDLRSKLVREIRFVVERMRTETEPRTKIYYLSAVHGEMFRIFNLNFDRQLLFAHNVLNYTYQTMKARADAIVLGRDTLIDFPDGFFDRLCDYLERLASMIEENQNVYPILQDISCLAYITTGNGYYLYQKETLRF